MKKAKPSMVEGRLIMARKPVRSPKYVLERHIKKPTMMPTTVDRRVREEAGCSIACCLDLEVEALRCRRLAASISRNPGMIAFPKYLRRKHGQAFGTGQKGRKVEQLLLVDREEACKGLSFQVL